EGLLRVLPVVRQVRRGPSLRLWTTGGTGVVLANHQPVRLSVADDSGHQGDGPSLHHDPLVKILVVDY
ncbi:MAG: hypothetical protein M3439_09550, partial [Chloroflexota bacterium]|nr:hypothetical protein [Chloroflexota bacterium]